MILYKQNVPDSSLISYYDLTDKPFINGIMLDGSISLNDLGVPSLNNFNHQIDLFRLDLNSLRGSKQDKLISGTNIKTVNGNNLLGTGNINIASGVTSVNGQTGDVVINVKDIDLTDYVKTEDLAPIDSKITTLENNIKTIQNSSSNYYTKVEVSNWLAEKVSGMPNVSLPRIERIAALTPAEYEAITPNENTLYLIK